MLKKKDSFFYHALKAYSDLNRPYEMDLWDTRSNPEKAEKRGS
jgi:hypothetical protein